MSGWFVQTLKDSFRPALALGKPRDRLEPRKFLESLEEYFWGGF